MALAKDHHQTSSRSFYENMLEVGSSVQFPHISPYGFDHYDQQQDGDGFESPNSNNNITNDNKLMNNNNNNNNNNSQVISNSPSLSSSSSANSSNNGFTIHNNHASNYQPHEEANSLISFKSSYGNFIHSNNTNNGGSLLSFQHEDHHHHHHHNQVAPETYQKLSHPIDHHSYPIWEGSSSTSMNNHHQNLHLLEEVGRLRTSSGDYQDAANDWLYVSEADAGGDPPHQEPAPQRTSFNKRPNNNMEEETMQVPKKHCTSKKPAKPKSSSITKDPQSVAAKNRRERISERLKILQDLVPNGSKVDLVTMLEKAIGYVKFLQLQVKVLATDEFWPAAGGKAPDICQVREAIDAILLSQRSEGTTTTTTTTSSN